MDLSYHFLQMDQELAEFLALWTLNISMWSMQTNCLLMSTAMMSSHHVSQSHLVMYFKLTLFVLVGSISLVLSFIGNV